MMKFRMILSTLFALLTIENGYANIGSESERRRDLDLAHRFSPILILTEDITDRYGDVIRPEPVEIVGADSARNLVFDVTAEITNENGDIYTVSGTVNSFEGWIPPLQNSVQSFDVDFAQNEFASLPKAFNYEGIAPGVFRATVTVIRSKTRFAGQSHQSAQRQYFSQIGVIPSGLEPFGLDADLGRLLLLEQTHGNLSQEGHIFRGMAGAYP